MKRSNSSSNGVVIKPPRTPRINGLKRSNSVPAGIHPDINEKEKADLCYAQIKECLDKKPKDVTGAKSVLVHIRPGKIVYMAMTNNDWEIFKFLVIEDGCGFVVGVMPLSVWTSVNENFVRDLICYHYASENEILDLFPRLMGVPTPGLSEWLKNHLSNSGGKIKIVPRGEED